MGRYLDYLLREFIKLTRACIFIDTYKRCYANDSFSWFCMSNSSSIQIITIFGFNANIYRSYLYIRGFNRPLFINIVTTATLEHTNCHH